jgi:hypothetical protein
MEAMLGISLYSYVYLNLAKLLCLSYYFLCFLFNKNWRRGQNRFCLEARGVRKEGGDKGQGEKWPKQCMHI